MATTARDIMTPNVNCVGESESLIDAARKMRDLNVGVLRVYGNNDRLTGLMTDRDIVICCVDDGRDPTTTSTGALCDDAPVSIGADDPIEDVLSSMGEYPVRRLPVMDDGHLIGNISESDIAHHAPDKDVADSVQAVTAK
jgi:CBS domain-containing protein